MKRLKTLIKYVLIILVYLGFKFYIGGYYFSKEKCDEATMRSLYANETIHVMDFTEKNKSISVYTNPEERTVSLIGSEKKGFLYKGMNSLASQPINDEPISVITMRVSDFRGDILLVYRNDPNVSTIEIDQLDGTIILWGWKDDFAGWILKQDDIYKNTCKAFDDQGNLIAEIPLNVVEKIEY